MWVDSYRRKFRVGLPDVVDPIELPEAQTQLLNTLREKTGRFGGCWDLLLWKGDDTLFVELKRRGKDRIQITQTDWLSVALESGLAKDNFAIVEWDFLCRTVLYLSIQRTENSLSIYYLAETKKNSTKNFPITSISTTRLSSVGCLIKRAESTSRAY